MNEANVITTAFGQQVIASGVVIARNDASSSVIIDPEDTNDNRLMIEFAFEDNPDKQQQLQLGGDAEKLTVTFVNHTNALGTSFKEPIEVASNKTSVLSLMAVTHAVQDVRVVNYMLLTRKKSGDGKSA